MPQACLMSGVQLMLVWLALGRPVGSHPVALHKVEAPVGEADVLFEPVHPVHDALSQALVGVIQICSSSQALIPRCSRRTRHWSHCDSALSLHMYVVRSSRHLFDKAAMM